MHIMHGNLVSRDERDKVSDVKVCFGCCARLAQDSRNSVPTTEGTCARQAPVLVRGTNRGSKNEFVRKKNLMTSLIVDMSRAAPALQLFT